MIQQIVEAIEEFETIIIHRHVRPDPDAYGSQGGLAEIIKATYPNKNVWTVGEEEESLHFLRRMDVIEDKSYEDALVIVCDTANQERVSDQRYNKGSMLIKIDHHPNEDPYGDIMWVDTSASSVSEMIYEFYVTGKEKGLKMTNEAARLLYAGIVGDTGRFLYPSTTEKTFAYASELTNYSFSRTDLYNQLYETPLQVVKLQGYIFQEFELLENGAAAIYITKDNLQKFNLSPAEASSLVSSLGNIAGIVAWVFFIEEDDQIRVRFRSKGPVINSIAKKYNGGGHPLAAGASIYSWDVAKEVLNDLQEACYSFIQK
ncbi:bifunctional oligoribonuclease/PAP phosphatase NrnA [Bacillus carboniphilus]|uniref:Bifunctional oligoribonuclease/PAP phosphatase NrnA n=1 Tax=Bacillus carboniphilus TaxID=86663 RepID=A0ABP3G1W1_9BACI